MGRRTKPGALHDAGCPRLEVNPADLDRQPASGSFAFVALGSNLGDRRRNILAAFEQLQTLSDLPLLKSSLWPSEPVECPPESPPFINAAAGLLPRLDETPESLLLKLQDIERQFGRQTKLILNEPRTLDLDLIAFGALTRAGPELVIPHPRAHLRLFVLQPLSEIAPNLLLPGQTRSVRELLEALEGRADLLP
jgi:2-amino-4-hydroxy-6-hydroxymethyldihydropteridine diphosphokinase